MRSENFIYFIDTLFSHIPGRTETDETATEIHVHQSRCLFLIYVIINCHVGFRIETIVHCVI